MGEGGRASTGRNHSEPFKPADANAAVREALLSPSIAPLAVRPIVMDFRHENMLISVRSEPGTGEAACLAMNVKWKLPPSILHSSFFPSIAVSEMPKDHFFCFADCANAERERRTRLDSSQASSSASAAAFVENRESKKVVVRQDINGWPQFVRAEDG